jgi:phasin
MIEVPAPVPPTPAGASHHATSRNINVPAFRRLSAMTENVMRELAERSAAYAKDTYGKTQAAAGDTTKLMQQTYSAASKGAADFNLHLLEIAQTNTNAAFDFARQLTRVTSPSEFFELTTAHARKQFETLSEQTQDLTTLAQKLTTEAAQPFQAGVAQKFNRKT